MNITPEVKNSLLNSYKNAVHTAKEVHGSDNIPVLVDLGIDPDQDVWPLLKEMTMYAAHPKCGQSLDIRVNGLGYKSGTSPDVFIKVNIHRRKVFHSETHISVRLVTRLSPVPFETFFEGVVRRVLTISYCLVFIDNRERTGLSAEVVLMDKLKDRVVECFHDAGITIDAKIGNERLFIEPEKEAEGACLEHPKYVSLIKCITGGVVDSAIRAGIDAKITVTGKVKKADDSIGTFHIRDRATIE